MFHHLHRRNWFPFLIVGLSILLLLFVVWAYLSRNDVKKVTQQVSEQPAVTVEDYQHEISNLLKNFEADYLVASTISDKLFLIENLEERILLVRVPAEERNFHLQLATTFEALRSDLSQNDASGVAEDIKKIKEIFINNSWLGISLDNL